jgi:hypothetical protein
MVVCGYLLTCKKSGGESRLAVRMPSGTSLRRNRILTVTEREMNRRGSHEVEVTMAFLCHSAVLYRKWGSHCASKTDRQDGKVDDQEKARLRELGKSRNRRRRKPRTAGGPVGRMNSFIPFQRKSLRVDVEHHEYKGGLTQVTPVVVLTWLVYLDLWFDFDDPTRRSSSRDTFADSRSNERRENIAYGWKSAPRKTAKEVLAVMVQAKAVSVKPPALISTLIPWMLLNNNNARSGIRSGINNIVNLHYTYIALSN